MPAKALTTLCMIKIMDNIKLVTGIGHELPHDNPHVKMILYRIPTATQLRDIELNSPQLQGHTEYYWKEMIRRHFPASKRKNYVPSDPTGWHKVYKRHKKEHDESLEAANAALKNAYNNVAAEKEKNVAVIVNSSQLPRPPLTGRALRGGGRRGQKAADTSSLNFTSGSKTKLNSGKNILKRARREAKDAAAQQRGPLGRLSGGVGAIGPSQLKAAPRGFLESNRAASKPQIRAPPASSAKKPAPAIKRHASPLDDAHEPIVLTASDSNSTDSDPSPDETDDSGPPAKKPKLGPRRPGYAAKEPLYDSDDDEESAGSGESSSKPPRLNPASSRAGSVKRKAGALLPGKPGAGRFLSHPPATSSGKAPASQKPSRPSPPARPSPSSAAGSKGAVRPALDAGRGSSPPQERPAASGSKQSPMPPRKKKVDIFMKPKPRRRQ